MTTIAVIPARFGSTRFPGKPLALLHGKPMIQWVYERAAQVQEFDSIYVATDNDDISACVKGFGGQAMMTDPNHPSGTDRVWEVAQQVPEAQFIFNIQGDEPLINPLHLVEACNALQSHHESVDIVTLKAPVQDIGELRDPNVVKVVTAENGKALYFSRSAIPHIRDKQDESVMLENCFRHIGIYGFTRKALQRFVALPVSKLEAAEKLEQLRALEAGMTIKVLFIPEAPIGVDTPEDLERIRLSTEDNKECCA